MLKTEGISCVHSLIETVHLIEQFIWTNDRHLSIEPQWPIRQRRGSICKRSSVRISIAIFNKMSNIEPNCFRLFQRRGESLIERRYAGLVMDQIREQLNVLKHKKYFCFMFENIQLFPNMIPHQTSISPLNLAFTTFLFTKKKPRAIKSSCC